AGAFDGGRMTRPGKRCLHTGWKRRRECRVVMPSFITPCYWSCNVSTRYDGIMAFRSGNGAAWRDCVSPLSGRYRGERVDAIDSLDSLRAWLREFGLEPVGAVTSDDVT